MKKRLQWLLLLMPLFSTAVFCQGTAKVKVYDNGNTSIKINDSKEALSMAETQAWLQSSGLAFSQNEEELYFRHPTDNYYQVWNVASKQKTAEIPFSEAGNTPRGHTIIASFPNMAYAKDSYLNSKIWISEDMQVSFDKKDNLILYRQNTSETAINLDMRWHVDRYNFMDYEKFRKKVELTNIKYQFYFHKKSNKLFIAVEADQITKDKNNYPYCGVYYFDLNTNTTTALTENMKCACVSGNTYRYRWYFSGNYLFSYYVKHPDILFKQVDLNTVSPNDLLYAKLTPPMVFSDRNPNGWYIQHIGADEAGNAYLADPTNNHLLISKFDRDDKSKVVTAANIQHSANRKNTVHPKSDDEIWNVMAISPSGKQFAYINLNHRTEVGNYASIMLYNLDEKDRVYTLNDQTKYQPYIDKNYITNKESEDLALAWTNQRETGKNKRRALYQAKIDSLKTKIAEAEKMLVATYQQDIDLAKQKNYAAVLTGKKWNGYKTYSSTMTYTGENGGSNRTITADFKIKEELEFIKRGDNIDVKIIETLTLPMGKLNDYGELILKDKDLSEKTALEFGYKPRRYITSACSAPLSEFKWPQFRLGNSPYIGCSDPFGSITGAEAINESKYYKKFTDEFMNFLWKCSFKFYLSQGSLKLTLLAIGKDGTEIGFDYETTNAQAEIIDRKNNLTNQLRVIEEFIEKGN